MNNDIKKYKKNNFFLVTWKALKMSQLVLLEPLQPVAMTITKI